MNRHRRASRSGSRCRSYGGRDVNPQLDGLGGTLSGGDGEWWRVMVAAHDIGGAVASIS
jgi:hypothetical protein